MQTCIHTCLHIDRHPNNMYLYLHTHMHTDIHVRSIQFLDARLASEAHVLLNCKAGFKKLGIDGIMTLAPQFLRALSEGNR